MAVGNIALTKKITVDDGFVLFFYFLIKKKLSQVLQLYQISNLNHGLMMVGPSGSGKSTAWKVLLKALERFEGTEGVAHVIDPKAISKEALYGVLDPNTREWTDGLFTHILR